jgi:hypothetical protein
MPIKNNRENKWSHILCYLWSRRKKRKVTLIDSTSFSIAPTPYLSTNVGNKALKENKLLKIAITSW